MDAKKIKGYGQLICETSMGWGSELGTILANDEW
jgi:hypothetical protein